MALEPVQVFPNKGQGHAEYMEMALKQASIAFEKDEIPIGAKKRRRHLDGEAPQGLEWCVLHSPTKATVGTPIRTGFLR